MYKSASMNHSATFYSLETFSFSDFYEITSSYGGNLSSKLNLRKSSIPHYKTISPRVCTTLFCPFSVKVETVNHCVFSQMNGNIRSLGSRILGYTSLSSGPSPRYSSNYMKGIYFFSSNGRLAIIRTVLMHLSIGTNALLRGHINNPGLQFNL